MMQHFRKNVTDDERRAHMQAYIESLKKPVRSRIRPEDIPKPAPQVRPKTESNEITGEERELLEDILEKPYLSITRRTSRLGLSAYKMNRLKGSAIRKKLVEQVRINLGRKFGGRVTFLMLLENGYRAIGRKPVRKPDNVSREHWFWQLFLKDYCRRKGLVAEIEKCMNGIYADLGVTKNQKLFAYEIETSPKNALSNIVSDLTAGFHMVISCCVDQNTAREVTRRLKEYEKYEQIRDRVEVRVLTELQAVNELRL
jgi:hypothetical protein